MGYELIQHRFHEMLERLRAVNQLCAQYLNAIPKEQWTQPYRPNHGVIDGMYCVDLKKMTFGCGRFQALCYPCAHAIATCASECIDCMTYIDKAYRLEDTYNVWKSRFPAILNESMWPPTLHAPFKLVLGKNSRCKLTG
ncbi:hypothetical protein J1N35_025899 [Gossypium stocksii]|uniref:SWIM-type domain-containing protein n=1 Tax=Gossypium stocksii TaxID=47602 RepID=A0A9D3V777_9ROSI|nr:hypothetical protein J1N35_025899 [Gossypium stocksii]